MQYPLARAIRILLLAFALGTLTSSAYGAVLWRGDFETGNLSQWSYKFTEAQLSVVTTPVRAGKYALKASALKEGDRVEVQYGNNTTPEGTERYYAWSVMTPVALTGDHQTGYFESKQTYNQIMSFSINGSDASLVTRLPNSQSRWQAKGKFTSGVWHDYVFHVKWSQNAANGFIELWFDGQKVLNQTSVQTLWDGNGAFFQIGFLSGHAGEVIYIDEAREGSTFEDVQLPPGPDAGVAGVVDAGARDAAVIGGKGGGAGSAGGGGTGGSASTAGAGGSSAGGTGGAGASPAGSSGSNGGMAGSGSGGSGDGGSGGTSEGGSGGTPRRASGGCAIAAGEPDSIDGFWLILAAVGIVQRQRRRHRSS